MSKEFKERLQLYKEGKLQRDEVVEIEAEIDKFVALFEYLNIEDKELIEELKSQAPLEAGTDNSNAKRLKKRINLKIFFLSITYAFCVLVVLVFLYICVSTISTQMFGLGTNEIEEKTKIESQLAQMFQPQYKSNGNGMSNKGFAQQYISIYLNNSVGNTVIEQKKNSVKYSFGKPVDAGTYDGSLLIFDNPFFVSSHESDGNSGFDILENAPKGTKAKVLIKFSKALAPHEIKENFLKILSNEDSTLLEIAPIATCGSDFVIGNPSYFIYNMDMSYYDNDSSELKLQESNDMMQATFDKMDDQAHKESLISNLKLIQSNQKLLQVMYYNVLENKSVDDLIKYVNDNGVEYVGMYLAADSKELLKLKDSDLIKEVKVENIVLW